MTCPALQNFAFNSHVKCYVDNGFCDLALNIHHPINTGKFLEHLLGVYDISDFFSSIAVKQVYQVLDYCKNHHWTNPLLTLNSHRTVSVSPLLILV